MSHSHLAVRHLIRKLELTPRRPGGIEVPAWMRRLIEQLSDLFEPFRGDARVGYECARDEDDWELALFLGGREQIGGAADGEIHPINFRFDIGGLTPLFDTIQSLSWNAFPAGQLCFDDSGDLSFLSIVGRIGGQTVRVQIQSHPPEEAGPAPQL